MFSLIPRRCISVSATLLKKGVKLPMPRIELPQYARPSNPTLINLEGVEEHPLKYHTFWPKKEGQPYGIQGSNHLIAEKGKIAKRLPHKMKLEKDKTYSWCACGQSKHQPLCDGSHKFENTALRPVRFIPDKDMEVWFCQCKQTANRPFCDGTHKVLPEPEPPLKFRKTESA